MAIVVSPVFFALLYGTAELPLGVSILLTVLAVAACRGLIDVIANASVIADQTGAGFLVLDRLNQAEAAQEQVRSTLKA